MNIFLNSSYGLKQIRKFTRRAVNQANINAEELKVMKIAVLSKVFQDKIAELSNDSWQNFQRSISLYSQAESLLLEEVGLKNLGSNNELWNIVNLSEVKQTHRIDADYFQPKYDDLFGKVMKQSSVKKLGEVALVARGSLITPNFYDYSDGTLYIRGGDFSSGSLSKESSVYISSVFKPKNETKVECGDIVFALIGSVGTSALVDRDFANSFISNNVGKIVIENKEKLLPEYLAVVLHSMVGKFQFEKEASQTAQPKISDSQVSNFLIPILPVRVQQEIAELVRESYASRKRAKALFEQAKAQVEQLIESQASSTAS